MYQLPTPEQFDELLQEARVVLDTSALLAVFDQAKQQREELLQVFENFRHRLWIPYQVWLEYDRKRSQRFDQIHALLEEDEAYSTKLALSIAKEEDETHRRITAIFHTRRGAPPADQAALDKLFSEGSLRFSKQIPPGFEDLKSKKGITFYYGGLEYHAEYGDWLVWSQTLEGALRDRISKLIFVTNDRKKDWWKKDNGDIVGPKPELLKEMAEFGGARLNWIYTLPRFLRHLTKYFRLGLPESTFRHVEIAADLVLPGIYTNLDMMNSFAIPIDAAGHVVRQALEKEKIAFTQIANIIDLPPHFEVCVSDKRIAVAVMILSRPLRFFRSYQLKTIKETALKALRAGQYNELWIYVCCRPVGMALDIEEGSERGLLRQLDNILPLEEAHRFPVKVRFGQYYGRGGFDNGLCFGSTGSR